MASRITTMLMLVGISLALAMAASTSSTAATARSTQRQSATAPIHVVAFGTPRAMPFSRSRRLGDAPSHLVAIHTSTRGLDTRRSILFELFMGRAAAVRANTKAKTDAKKTKINAGFGKKIIMAVKEGGSADPAANRMLDQVIKQAKSNSVPNDNIQRAIRKATEGNVGDFKESTFEVYGFGGASLVVNVLTDNNNRASSDIRNCVGKREAKIAEPGSVLFMYDRRGKIKVIDKVLSEDALLEAAIDAGCTDYELLVAEDEENDDGTTTTNTIVLTEPKESTLMMDAVKTVLQTSGPVADDAIQLSLCHVSKAAVTVSDAEFERNMQLIDALEDLDDVDSVEHNMSN